MNKRTSIRRTVDASGTALPVTFQPTDWFRSLTPNFAPQDLTMDMDALKLDYKSKINLLNSLKAELRVLVTNNVSNETIADLQKNVSDLKKGMLEDEKTYYKGLTDTQINMVKLAFEMASKGDIVGFISQEKATAIEKLKNLNSNDFAELFGLAETTLKSMLENTYDLYQKHLDYFEKYQDLLQAQLSYAASQTSDYSDRISILTEWCFTVISLDAFPFMGTFVTVFAFINCFLTYIARLAFDMFYVIHTQLFIISAYVSIGFFIILHVFYFSEIILIFSCF